MVAGPTEPGQPDAVEARDQTVRIIVGIVVDRTLHDGRSTCADNGMPAGRTLLHVLTQWFDRESPTLDGSGTKAKAKASMYWPTSALIKLMVWSSSETWYRDLPP